jgi:hypothetical protein
MVGEALSGRNPASSLVGGDGKGVDKQGGTRATFRWSWLGLGWWEGSWLREPCSPAGRGGGRRCCGDAGEGARAGEIQWVEGNQSWGLMLVEGGRRQELGVRWSSSGNGAAVQSSCARQGRPGYCFCKHGMRRGEGGASWRRSCHPLDGRGGGQAPARRAEAVSRRRRRESDTTWTRLAGCRRFWHGRGEDGAVGWEAGLWLAWRGVVAGIADHLAGGLCCCWSRAGEGREEKERNKISQF